MKRNRRHFWKFIASVTALCVITLCAGGLLEAQTYQQLAVFNGTNGAIRRIR